MKLISPSRSMHTRSLSIGDEKFPKNRDGSMKYDTVPPIETWRAMEKLVDEGLVRYIGLSNFNSQQVDEVMIIQVCSKSTA